jgi:hypothetical protein
MENEKIENSKEIENELNILKGNLFKDIEKGSLIVVQVGTEATPATKSDIERTAMSLNNLFKEAKGVKVLILPHLVTIDVISLPTLRKIESEIVNSFEDSYEEPIVIGLDLLGGMI